MHTPAHKRFCKPEDMISQTALIVINYSCSLFIPLQHRMLRYFNTYTLGWHA